jgi:hypothetical protein
LFNVGENYSSAKFQVETPAFIFFSNSLPKVENSQEQVMSTCPFRSNKVIFKFGVYNEILVLINANHGKSTGDVQEKARHGYELEFASY